MALPNIIPTVNILDSFTHLLPDSLILPSPNFTLILVFEDLASPCSICPQQYDDTYACFAIVCLCERSFVCSSHVVQILKTRCFSLALHEHILQY